MKKFSGDHFYKVDDVRGGPIRETIAAVTIGKYDKPNLVFEGGSLLSLNATNNSMLMRAFGRDSDGWIGKEIELTLGKAQYQGDEVDSVIVKLVSPPIAAKDKAVAAKKFDDELNDETPF